RDAVEAPEVSAVLPLEALRQLEGRAPVGGDGRRVGLRLEQHPHLHAPFGDGRREFDRRVVVADVGDPAVARRHRPRSPRFDEAVEGVEHLLRLRAEARGDAERPETARAVGRERELLSARVGYVAMVARDTYGRTAHGKLPTGSSARRFRAPA